MSDTVLEARRNVARANRILYLKGVVDGFGHVSCRHPEIPDHYLISCNRAPNLVKESDIVELDADSNPVGGDARRLYLERFIHGEIYRTRPDVNAVVHSHSIAMITIGATDVQIRPMFHMAGFLTRAAKFDIREATGRETDMLIRDPELGRNLAETLGPASAVLMAGHGATMVGTSLEEAVYRAVYAEINAGMQLNALRVSGNVRYLSDKEGDLATETNRGQLKRCWDLWCAEVNIDD
ncbi:class II aldolase/adducin family protein [Pigmentiphaga sp.]|jgi:Ribulose-5-phosphate 4-epimerase and related epimerases and aldolases|uniref:class II aldolase/adducin family protein n=1 Tax=Pigmentiphaga sp. TaxID=1977564 RepID=UPI0025DEF76F|nr:class II aldolase/adducin family protein [Pigmentiphaga sp.]MBX6318324.1 class II aldolase/adducin family protein [Pigmentiphaga sp.]